MSDEKVSTTTDDYDSSILTNNGRERRRFKTW